MGSIHGSGKGYESHSGWLTVLGMTLIIAPYKSGGIKGWVPVFS